MSNATRMSNRRWVQFSLRTILVVFCVLGVGLGVLGNFVIRVRTQRQLVAKIEALGGECDYDYKDYEDHEFFYFPTSGPGNSGPPGPAWLRRLFGDDVFAQVVWVSFDNSAEIRDADLELLSDLPHLRYVEIYSPVSDAGAEHLARLPELRYLRLAHARLTPTGCARLASVKSLAELELENGTSDFNDEALAHIASLPKLRALKVEPSGISNEGMRILRGCTNLEALHVSGTPLVTDPGIIQLFRLPRLRMLQLHTVPMTDESMPHLANMQQLRSLFIAHTYITDSGLRELHGHKNLVQLEIYGDRHSEITKAGGLELLQALPNCRPSVWLEAVPDWDRASSAIVKREETRWINIRNERY